MLTITDLHAAINGKAILQGLSLAVKPGEVHAIMGPNGAGKSTLTKALMGHPACTVTGGSITFAGRNLLDLPTEERSRAGIFVGFQYPVEVPGVNNADFLFAALNARRLGQGQVPLTRADFDRRLDRTLADLGINPVWKGRDLNSGFSGGEKKRNELLQLHILEPSLAVLDETDSGLDIDALRAVSAGINAWMRPDRALVLITHYERLLGLVTPHHVHVLSAGRIVRSGGPELAAELERRGYDGVAG